MSNQPDQRPLAHVRQLPNGKWDEHFLDEHLHEVANLARKFAEQFGSEDWASLAGMWHDLGKHSVEFQQYIKSVSGYDAHIEAPGRVDHSTAGAIHAIRQGCPIGTRQKPGARHSPSAWGRSKTTCSTAYQRKPYRKKSSHKPSPQPSRAAARTDCICGCVCCSLVWLMQTFSTPKPSWMATKQLPVAAIVI